ncbi:MAG: SpoIIE family protein phosphatase [Clostridia bacterium]
MNNLCTDIGMKSLIKYNEELCGDHFELIDQGENSQVLVLADGMGSGVKANILSTLTSKILSTMIAEGISVEECVLTMASTLPVCAVRNVAYSTFTILRIIDNKEAEIIQYDNPHTILLRHGQLLEFPKEALKIDGKIIYKSKLLIEDEDVFITTSDGAIHAGVGANLNFGWDRKEIIEFMEMMYHKNHTAKMLTDILLSECNRLYGGKPGDDTTVCTIKIRQADQVNLMIGPPSKREDVQRMQIDFFSNEGRYIVCGGTTSTITGEFLKKPVIANLSYFDPEVPPTASIEGVDLVTEGVITMSKVLEYANDYLAENELYSKWGYKQDGASKIARMLFEDATNINFYVGRAVNPAHQNPNLPITFNIKMQLVESVAECLRKMGKKVKLRYF